jgi:hypothetical protein
LFCTKRNLKGFSRPIVLPVEEIAAQQAPRRFCSRALIWKTNQLTTENNMKKLFLSLVALASSSMLLLAQPASIQQPTNQTVTVGGTVNFSVTAGGTPPLSCQWNFNGTNIDWGTNTSLTLTNVQFSQAGNYAVLVTNAYGSILSSNAVLMVTPPPPCAPAPSGLVGWWPGEGDANDVLGLNNGTLMNGVGFAPGEVGQAFSLDGVSSYVSIPDSPLLDSLTSSLTIEAWIRVNQFPDGLWTAIVTKGDSSWRLHRYGNTSKLSFDTDGPGAELVSNGSVDDGQWHHVAAVYDGTHKYLYVDGALDASRPATGFIHQNSYPVCIGGNAEAPGRIWNGLIDEVSIYNRALTASEIQAIYLAGGGGKCLSGSPVFVFQPTNQTVTMCGMATFTVMADGTPPLSYQWNFNGTNIDWGTNTSLTLTNVQVSQAGNYAVLVTNAYGSILSSDALLTVLVFPPSISIQPTNQTVTVGGMATFTVMADGTPPLSYQWNFNGTNIDWGTNTSLTLTNVQFSQAGNYAVLVTNAYGSILSSNAVLMVNPHPPCAPVPTGLVGWWPGEGDANDVLGLNNGTLMNGVGFAPGEVGQAFSLDGVSSYVSIPDSPSLHSLTSSLTIEAWIRVNQFPNGGWTAIVTKGDSSWRLHRYGNTSRLAFDTDGLGAELVSNGSMDDGQWHHVAAVYDGTHKYLYVDGALDASCSATGLISQNSYPVCIGGNAEAPGRIWNGLIDEVSIYNRALTASEIQAIYLAGSSGKCIPQVAPSFLSQPTNQMVTVGSTVNFNVAASGTPHLSYQWNFNGTNLNGATHTSLTLTNVQGSQAGNYTVLVTNAFGSILSSNAVLVVTPDHFAWGHIPSPRFVNIPFAVTIRAQDLTNGIFTNFTGTAILGTTNAVIVTPSVSGNFVQGIWTGAVVISQTASNLVLQAYDGLGHFGLANPINVLNLPSLGMWCSGNIAMFMWPADYSGFVLETSGKLSPASWVVVPYVPFQFGDEYFLPLNMTGTNGFYRLQFPGP